MKHNMKSLRREVGEVMRTKLTAVHLIDETPNASAHCEYDEDSIEVWVDCYYSDILRAVVHEVLHSIFDKHFQNFVTYNVYEYWICSLEKPILRGMARKEKRRWVRLIASKIS